jgi:hypothetical protein
MNLFCDIVLCISGTNTVMGLVNIAIAIIINKIVIDNSEQYPKWIQNLKGIE